VSLAHCFCHCFFGLQRIAQADLNIGWPGSPSFEPAFYTKEQAQT